MGQQSDSALGRTDAPPNRLFMKGVGSPFSFFVVVVLSDLLCFGSSRSKYNTSKNLLFVFCTLWPKITFRYIRSYPRSSTRRKKVKSVKMKTKQDTVSECSVDPLSREYSSIAGSLAADPVSGRGRLRSPSWRATMSIIATSSLSRTVKWQTKLTFLKWSHGTSNTIHLKHMECL